MVIFEKTLKMFRRIQLLELTLFTWVTAFLFQVVQDASIIEICLLKWLVSGRNHYSMSRIKTNKNPIIWPNSISRCNVITNYINFSLLQIIKSNYEWKLNEIHTVVWKKLVSVVFSRINQFFQSDLVFLKKFSEQISVEMYLVYNGV